MKVSFKYLNKEFNLEPYTSKQEKDLILLPDFAEKEELLDKALEVLNFNPKGLSENEKKVILYKFREISVGDKVTTKFTCPHCGQTQEQEISISNLITEPIKKSKYIKNPLTNSNNIFDYFKNIDDLDWCKFEELKDNLKDYIVSFNFKRKCNCIKCKEENTIDISDNDFIIHSLSELSYSGIMTTYTNLVYYGHYSKLDVDSMYPFERFILERMLEKEIEALRKRDV